MNIDMQYLVSQGPDPFPTFRGAMDSAGPYLVPEYFGTWVAAQNCWDI